MKRRAVLQGLIASGAVTLIPGAILRADSGVIEAEVQHMNMMISVQCHTWDDFITESTSLTKAVESLLSQMAVAYWRVPPSMMLINRMGYWDEPLAKEIGGDIELVARARCTVREDRGGPSWKPKTYFPFVETPRTHDSNVNVHAPLWERVRNYKAMTSEEWGTVLLG